MAKCLSEAVSTWMLSGTVLKFNGHWNELLQKEWNEYGGEHFSFEILSGIKQEEIERVDYAKEADKLEQMFLEK